MTTSAFDKKPALSAPERGERDWKKRVEAALRAREMSQELRRGKPRSFRRAVGRAK